jgi:hypothetical protein
MNLSTINKTRQRTPKQKITYVEKREKICHDTGEIKEEENINVIKLPKEEDYIKVYIKHINYLNNLPTGTDTIIYSLIKRVNYDNEIYINNHLKKKISEETGLKLNTVNMYISKLVEKDVLIRIDRGVYILNPIFYGKGKWKDILNLREKLEIQVIYEEGEYRIIHKFKQ